MHRLVPLALVAGLVAAGCTHPAPHFRVEPSAYYTHGYYMGSSSNVKVFVETITFMAEHRGTIAVDLAILNERTEQIRFLAAQNFLLVGSRRLNCEDAQGYSIRPGELWRTTIEFRTDQSDFDRGTLELQGVEVARARLNFAVPFYAVDPDAEDEAVPLTKGGLKRS
jgi:hypothetical protein